MQKLPTSTGKEVLIKMASKGVYAILVIALLLIGGIGGTMVYYSRQTAMQTSVEDKTPAEISVESNAGTLTQVKARTIDVEDASQSQVASTLYCWNKANPKVLISNGATTSATAGTDTTVSPVTIGSTIVCTAFDSTYYGDVVEKVIETEGELIVVPVHAITSSLYIELNYQSTYATGGYTLNASGMTANAVFTFAQMKVKNNNTYSAFNLKGFAFDKVASSNVTDLVLGGSVVESSEKITRLSDTADWRFDLSEAKLMRQYDELVFPSLVVEADGNGCDDAGADIITIRVFDEQQFKSAVSGTDAVLKGVETNAPSPADVGSSDYLMAFRCSKASA